MNHTKDAPKEKEKKVTMKYIHTSQDVSNAMKVGKPSTFNIGRNAKKRELREGKPRKYWRSLAQDYGYDV